MESVGRPDLRFQAVAAMQAASGKKEVFLLTPSKRLAHVYDTDRWNLDFPAELALR